MTRLALLAALSLAATVLGGCESATTTTRPATSTSTAPARPAASAGTSIAGAAPGATPGASTLGPAITAAGLQERLDDLAGVSAGDGFRSVGSGGFDAAAELVVANLKTSGWQVHEDAFTTPAFVDGGGSSVVVDGQTFAAGDVAPLVFAPGGDVSGPIVAIDWDDSGPPGKGCAVAGYGGLPAGAIVLVRPGGCFRRQQVLSAQEAGAAGFLAGYPAAAAGAVLRPTLIHPGLLTIPAAGVTGPVGDALAVAAAAGGTARLVSNATTAPAATRSIIAELPGSEPGLVVMLGAHLDSVVDGPGLNDNGSGVAALLELARALGGSHPRATIRLGFWSAEELGLHGSTHYVVGLTDAEREAILVYLNADMVASPNGFAGVYDASNPPSSPGIRDLLLAAVTRAGGSPIKLDVGAGSDHVPFDKAGIPTGGVFSGEVSPVSDAEAAASGATAGLPADPCYHQACDDGSDLDVDLARVLTTALADVALQVANDPSLVTN